MIVTQCDNCRRIGPVPPLGWFVLSVQEALPTFLSVLSPSVPESPPTFCSLRCLAQWAAVKALVESTGLAEPDPRKESP